MTATFAHSEQHCKPHIRHLRRAGDLPAGYHSPMALRLKELRIEAGLTVEQLAALAGISKSYLSEMENGRKTINRNRPAIFALCEFPLTSWFAMCECPPKPDSRANQEDDQMTISAQLHGLDRMFARVLTIDATGRTFGVIKCVDGKGGEVSIFTDPETARIVVAAFDANRAAAKKEAV